MREHSALIVVDVQRDFCPGGTLPASGCDRIIPALNQYLADAHALGMTLYASRDWHPEATTHFAAYGGRWPPHCVQGTPGAQFHPALQLPAATVVVTKGDDPGENGYSAFDGHTPDGRSLLDDLRTRGVTTLFVGGLATEYCVRQTAMDALHAGLRVNVLIDAVAGIEAQPGDTDQTLRELRAAGAVVSAGLPSADVVLLDADWRSRIAVRAQLIEDGIEVAAADTWPTMRRHLQPGGQPRLAVVDLNALSAPRQVLEELRMLMPPSRVLVVAAMGTVAPDDLERMGFRVLRRPLTVENIVSAVATCLRASAT